MTMQSTKFPTTDLPDLESGVKVATTHELGALLRSVRKSAGLVQASVSGLAGQGSRFISDAENGKPTIQAQKLFDLVEWLGLEIVIRKKRSK